jgi:signal transduction histidine kinase
VATLLGLFSAFQAHRLVALETGKPGFRPPLLLLNLVYWYAPALLTPLVIRFAQRFRFDTNNWKQTLLVHIPALGLFSLATSALLIGARIALFPERNWATTMTFWQFCQHQYFMNFDWSMMTFCSIVGLTNGVDYYRESRERTVRTAQLETKLVEAQFKTLQGQLHPHFLFNTLHAVSALLHKDPEAADRMISRLSDLLRLTLELTGVQEISLKKELEFLEKYLEIEQIRFRDRLAVKFNVDAAVLDARVPMLILQPIVENAIKHGIGPHVHGGTIEISASREGDRLMLEVHDTGGGLSESALSALQKGIGLSNTRARLECLYGHDHRFEFSNVHGGLTVRLVIPLHSDIRRAEPGETSRVA